MSSLVLFCHLSRRGVACARQYLGAALHQLRLCLGLHPIDTPPDSANQNRSLWSVRDTAVSYESAAQLLASFLLLLIPPSIQTHTGVPAISKTQHMLPPSAKTSRNPLPSLIATLPRSRYTRHVLLQTRQCNRLRVGRGNGPLCVTILRRLLCRDRRRPEEEGRLFSNFEPSVYE
ncbi:hypothetical protein M440DRAFT_1006939 [Trichoderma longibrachiatum ATCC 18648]|uniref:Uncharacterized protein n=1 Tax=Trichoderma longibrachiatum ATCC 18648 TaxID=983965 RepID=A0A2T4CHQ7_TRILO|nr:hypothetical protein M440DRAFT_1006939 [Trichoderma longibrachiatum ATCC 18648]